MNVKEPRWAVVCGCGYYCEWPTEVRAEQASSQHVDDIHDPWVEAVEDPDRLASTP